MKDKNIAIVITTIHKGTVVERLRQDDHYDLPYIMYVIGDKKTPKDLNHIDIKMQEAWLRDHKKLKSIIPYNSLQRRNIGYLMALESGADVVISMDDDNYPLDVKEFINEHSRTGGDVEDIEYEEMNGWFNIGHNISPIIWLRGFPYNARTGVEKIRKTKRKRRIAINEGLWIGNPDVDAITNLALEPNITYVELNCILAKDTWSPINSQNTSISRKAMPAYFCIPGVGRFDDIIGGYFARKCIDRMNEHVRYGTPVVWHWRNSHNYLADLKQEIEGIYQMEEYMPKLREMELRSKTYASCYNEIADNLPKTKYWQHVAKCMRIWIDEVESVI